MSWTTQKEELEALVRQAFKIKTGFCPTAADLMIIGLLLVTGLAGFVFMAVCADSQKPCRVAIEVDGQEFAEYDFNFEESVKKVEVKTKFGYNIIELEKGRVRVLEASCPNRLDVNAGWISNAGEMLVCLPNRMVVRLEGGETGVDSVVY